MSPGAPTEASERRLRTELLLEAGRLLLEYNESSGEIIRVLQATAGVLTGERLHVHVAYRSVTVSLGGESPMLATVTELRYNAAIQSRVQGVLRRLRGGGLDPSAALAQLREAERDTRRHPPALVAVLLGAAAASFARLLGADAAATAVSGVAASLGFLARHQLGRRHVSLLELPLMAAFLGALLAGLVIRIGWTASPELALIVPALMLVPGPHLINGLFDLFDNHLPMSLARLGLAGGILLASGLGIAVGIEATGVQPGFAGSSAAAAPPNFVADMLLAGVATCGFAAFYNTPWRYIGLAAAGGMVGHGARYLALAAGLPLETATFFGGLLVGSLAAGMARSHRAPVAVLAFAGAVTMIPGSTLYRALGGALQLARLSGGPDAELAARTLQYACEAVIVVSGLVLGLVLGIRAARAVFRERRAVPAA